MSKTDKKLSYVPTLEIIESIRSLNDIDDVMEIFIKQSKNIFPYKACSLYLLSEDTNNFELRKNINFTNHMKKEVKLMIDEGIIDWIIEYGGFKVIPAMMFQDNEKKKSRTCDNAKYIITPLVVRQRLIGIFVIFAEIAEEEIIVSQLDTLFLIANQTAYSIENCLLYSDMNRKIRELEVLFETGKSMSQITDMTHLLNVIINMASDIISAETIVLYILDKETNLLSAITFKGKGQEFLSNFTIPFGEGISGWVAKEKQPIIINDYKNDIRFKKEKKLTPVKVKNTLSTPLVSTGSNVVGVLTFYNSLNVNGFSDEDFRMLSALASYSGIAIERSTLYDSLKSGYLETIVALANAIEAKDPYTRGHTIRVTKYAVEIAQSLNMSKNDIELIRYAGILHDIGKIGIPESILLKPAKLNMAEYNIIKSHSVIGAQMIKSVSFLKDAVPIIKHHHEYMDGSGYPDGLKHEEIPFSARIITVADAFDAMTTDRPYRPAMSTEKAIDELIRNSKTQFDFTIANTLIGLLRRKRLVNSKEEIFNISDILGIAN